MNCFRIAFFIVVLALMQGPIVFAQQELISVLKKGDTTQLAGLFKQKNGDKHGTGEATSFFFENREVMPSYSEAWGYCEGDKTVEFKFVAKGTKIIYWSVPGVDSFTDREQCSVFEKDFIEFYGAPIIWDDLFKGHSFSVEGCGISGDSYTDLYKELDAKLRKKEYEILDSWLRSANLEKQLYALEGLKRAKIPIDAERRKIIEYILSKKDIVWMCMGCISEPYSIDGIAREYGYFDLLKK